MFLFDYDLLAIDNINTFLRGFTIEMTAIETGVACVMVVDSH